ncbi:MAG: PhnD/SsuA/transferrin family substrate-binding protein [Desulfuromonadaceae bacterium]|nr:PhnD/SsuA/transferrin family substrate-binding protein [Desulfuromonadaceae bacterium]MDD2856743.1 PhnD/SsuA/transferrin family substrate-binding protein [Desulfuromonadaceae bacterium]
MRINILLIAVLLSVISVISLTNSVEAREFKILIMQDQKGVAKKYRPLLTYLKKRGFDATITTAPGYSDAARMFANGTADAMFSGSGVAGCMIIKELAEPLVRPIAKDGTSTYHAVVVTRRGDEKFTGDAEYFRGKRVIFTPLASAGEFYYRSIKNIKTVNSEIEMSVSHSAALDALSRGAADVGIIKNLVWEKDRANYPGLVKTGEDTDENPEMCLIVSKKMDSDKSAALAEILLALKNDVSPEARKVKVNLLIQGYIPTTRTDFKHTLLLLKEAGVTKSFNFVF